MARKTLHQLAYTAIRIEGGLIPAEELTRLTTLESPEKTEQTEARYQIPKGLKLRDEIARNFKIAQNLWADFNALRQRQDAAPHRTTVNEFLLPLLRQTLGYTDLATAPAVQASNSHHHTYQIGHAALGRRMPVVLAGHDQPLDQAAERFGDTNPDTGRTRKRSPYMLAQEALNASDTSLWAVVCNGLKLRILRDNPSLTRPAYVEVDLEAIFTEELYADFTAFWLLAHASRFGKPGTDGAAEPADCPWERWRNAGQQTGVTARMNLRFQVEDALRSLGTGFLSHPANTALRAQLQDPETSSQARQAFFEQLLSLVYRFIFLATVEDRTDATAGRSLIFTPESTDAEQQRYWAGYSLTWLRERALRRSSHDTHSDLWQALSITFDGLATGQPALGLPALGGLFAVEQCPLLTSAQLDNRHLLAAVFQLGYFRQPTGLTRVNYRDMGAEELGSVYESLLELVPDLQHLSQPHAARLAFVGDEDDANSESSTKGNTRKLTGSYYTPDSLVQALIKSALEPVLAQTIASNPADPVGAVLQLTVCDPACGSGHFLLAAARRMADEVAKLRALANGGAPTPADYRHALRDVVSHCIYGVDKNPMAIALAKTALWLEAYTPDRPLTFIDHHLQVGDALLGVLDPKILENGIPDAAYAVLSGDDKAVASDLKKRNKLDLNSWKQVVANDLFAATSLAQDADAVEHLADDSLASIAAKRSAWSKATKDAQQSALARLADAYVAAFLAPKVPEGAQRIPLSGYLWGLLHPNATQADRQSTAELAASLCRAHSVFHWWLAFPQVAAQGGFSVMLGNPPWEQLQLSEEEFFAARAPSVAELAGEKRKKAIADLERSVPWLWEQFSAAKRRNEAANLFFRTGGRFPLSACGKLNTYALFSEAFLQATSPTGRAGFVVPTGIATDDSTKQYFEAISNGRLISLLDLRTGPGLFSEIGHQRFKFCLLTLGSAPSARFAFFALKVEELADPRRNFTLTPDDFALINPNTRTCPVFRSERDAELTKQLYRTAPVLIAEERRDDDGQLLQPERNSWGMSFSQGLFNMTSDSGQFGDSPAAPGEPHRLPLYEAKMIHHYDHRWATYVDNPEKPNGLDTEDVSFVHKEDPSFTVRPRYWVDEREVLARIALVPSRVANAWLAWRQATDATLSDEGGEAELATLAQCRDALTLALASWVAGAVFRQQVVQVGTATPALAPGLFDSADEPAHTPAPEAPHHGPGWSTATAWKSTQATERLMASQHPRLAEALKADGNEGKKALPVFQKWALQDDPVQGLGLSLDELALLHTLQQGDESSLEFRFLDEWMDRRSPRWLMGWRDICRSTDERTVIASVIPRVGVGNKIPLLFPAPSHGALRSAALLGNLSALTLDFVARQKIGGTTLNYFYMKQFPVLPPERYTSSDLAFIVPRVLELTYTAHDMQAWADDLLAAMPDADPRPPAQRGAPLPPFPWNPERRARLRAELDAYYARLYGLTRDELRYILDPADVMGPDYPSESFRVLKNNEMREFGEYRTQRLVLAAWDALAAGDLQQQTSASALAPKYSEQGVIRNAEEADFAGLIVAMVQASHEGISVDELQEVVAHVSMASAYLEPMDAVRLNALTGAMPVLGRSSALTLVSPFVQRLEAAGAVQRKRVGAASLFVMGASAIPSDVTCRTEHAEMAQLMLKLEGIRKGAQEKDAGAADMGQQAQGGR